MKITGFMTLAGVQAKALKTPAKADIRFYPDSETGDALRRDRRPMRIRPGKGAHLSLLGKITAHTLRGTFEISDVADKDDAYDLATVDSFEIDDAFAGGFGHTNSARRWFARVDTDNPSQGAIVRLVRLAANVNAAALEMAHQDRPAGPHMAALVEIEGRILPEFNAILKSLDLPPVVKAMGGHDVVHYRIAQDMAKAVTQAVGHY